MVVRKDIETAKAVSFLFMAKGFAKKFYNSKVWARCRDSYINDRILIDGGLCEVCGKKPGKIVHHKVMLTPANISNPEVALNHDMLRFECKECHDKEEDHFNDSRKEKKLLCSFDKDGNPVPIRTPPY